jgi:hypothetical protein
VPLDFFVLAAKGGEKMIQGLVEGNTPEGLQPLAEIGRFQKIEDFLPLHSLR